MQLNKIYSIAIIVILFSSFVTFETIRKSENKVLGIINPYQIEVDLNNNGVLDNGEIICVPNLKALTSDLTQNQSELEKQLKISHTTALKLGYITDIFVENALIGKNVKLKYTDKNLPNCQYAEIFVDNNLYSEKLKNSGLGFDESGNKNLAFNVQLKKAEKLKLIILNHKSNKYHTLDCKYGLIAHDAIIIPEKQKPNDAKPCKFCHINKTSHKTYKFRKFKNKTIPNYPLMLSNGSIRMYLTDLTTTLKPDNKCNSSVCHEVLNQINNSKSSIDIALYGWDNNPSIYNSLIKAKARGVKIRIVYDTSTKSYYPALNEFVKIANEKSTDTPKILMHNKFIIFDNSKVITGSMNFSNTGFSGFNTNCIFFINSSAIANIYQKEFEQMLQGKFHTSKRKLETKTVVLGKSKVTPLFSPKDKIVTSNIIPLINSAQKYIYIPAFTITHDEFTNSLINAKKRGVDVKIIVDATNVYSKKSKIKALRASNIPVKVENYAGKVHSKSIIIDDKFIIAGSMNFTNSGENKNDENVLIIEDISLAKYYKGFFEYLWKKIPERYLNHSVRAEGKYSIGSCSDGIDNNFDGKIDKEDVGCK